MWRWLSWTALLVLSATLLGIVLISAGFFDPQPLGSSRTTVELQQAEVPPQSIFTKWLDPALPENQFTLRLTAALEEGENDVGYGLAIGKEEDHISKTKY